MVVLPRCSGRLSASRRVPGEADAKKLVYDSTVVVPAPAEVSHLYMLVKLEYAHQMIYNNV